MTNKHHIGEKPNAPTWCPDKVSKTGLREACMETDRELREQEQK